MSAAAISLATFASPVIAATPEELDTLHQVLRTDELLAIMIEEGRIDAEGLRDEMFPGRGGTAWTAMVGTIYESQEMTGEFRAVFDRELGGTDVTPLILFFQSGLGQSIIGFEVEGRRAISDDEVEQVAREAYRSRMADPDVRLGQIEAYIALNDLVENNVAGAMTSNIAFFQGLIEGGGFEMSESDAIAQVWSQEEEIRTDTAEWVGAYLTLAYDPLSEADLDAYIALSGTRAGRDLNRALFAAFYNLFATISFDLGKAASTFMVSEDL